MTRTHKTAVAFAAYLLAIVGANWMISHIGQAVPGAHLLPVWFGSFWKAPSGVYLAGFAFIARDIVQRFGGHKIAVASIIVGAAVSWWIASPVIAVASGVTFLISETADYLTYSPLQRSNFPLAVFLSGIVGDVIDSALFLALAGLGESHLLPLLLGKFWVIWIAGIGARAVRNTRTFGLAAAA